jgi:hypothetical protein
VQVDGEQNAFWAERRAVVAFGVLTVAFWLSRAVFPQALPPLAPMPDFSGLVTEAKSAAPWIQQQVGLDAPADEILASLRRGLLIEIAKRWLQIGLGVTSGVLIALRLRAGRWLAVGLCAVMLVPLLFTQARLGLQGRFTTFWRVYAEHSPRLVADGLAVLLFYAGTLVYLTQRRVGAQFSTR